VGNNDTRPTVEQEVTRTASLVAIAGSVVLLTVVACRGSDDSTRAVTGVSPVVSKPTTTEQAVQLIRACEITWIFFPVGDPTYITFRSGASFGVARLDREALARAANAAREGGCDITIEIE
jgi:hypothetical protein